MALHIFLALVLLQIAFALILHGCNVHCSSLHCALGSVALLRHALMIASSTVHWAMHYSLIIALNIVHCVLKDALAIAFMFALRCDVIDLALCIGIQPKPGVQS